MLRNTTVGQSSGISPERRYGAAMKMTVRQGEGSADVWVLLTEDEAESIARALRSRLQGEAGYKGPGVSPPRRGRRGFRATIAVLDPE